MRKEHLQLLEFCTDRKNPKRELDFAFFSKDGYATATDTLQLIKIDLEEPPQENLFLHKESIKKALQYAGKKPSFMHIFKTKDYSIILVHPDGKDELLFGNRNINGVFPDINRIIGNMTNEKKEIKILHELFIEIGLFEVHKNIDKTLEYIFKTFKKIQLIDYSINRNNSICKIKFDSCTYVFLYKTEEQAKD